MGDEYIPSTPITSLDFPIHEMGTHFSYHAAREGAAVMAQEGGGDTLPHTQGFHQQPRSAGVPTNAGPGKARKLISCSHGELPETWGGCTPARLMAVGPRCSPGRKPCVCLRTVLGFQSDVWGAWGPSSPGPSSPGPWVSWDSVCPICVMGPAVVSRPLGDTVDRAPQQPPNPIPGKGVQGTCIWG